MQPIESNLETWTRVCGKDDIEPEGTLRFDANGQTFAVYRTYDDQFAATDGLCTHEKVHLAEGWLEDRVIECPKHGGRFDILSGRALGAPVCISLRTYDVRVEGDDIYIQIV